MLEERGVIGPPNGAKAREILDTGEDEYEEEEAEEVMLNPGKKLPQELLVDEDEEEEEEGTEEGAEAATEAAAEAAAE